MILILLNLSRKSGEDVGDALINDSDRAKIILTPVNLVIGVVIILLKVIITGHRAQECHYCNPGYQDR